MRIIQRIECIHCISGRSCVGTLSCACYCFVSRVVHFCRDFVRSNLLTTTLLRENATTTKKHTLIYMEVKRKKFKPRGSGKRATS